MKSKYNIIWIDDEYEKQIQFMNECVEIHKINLKPFHTQREGMDELARNLSKWDAVLLDAKMYDESENEVAKTTGLTKAITKISELSHKKKIPYFISTGQPDLLSNELFEETFGKYYIKERDDVVLIEDMMNTIDSLPEKQIEYKYRDVYFAMGKMNLNVHAKDIITSILLAHHFPSNEVPFDPLVYYNQLRQFLEYLFRACNKIGIIPDTCIPDNVVNLNQCSLYLAGKNANHIGVRFGEPGERVVPLYIELVLRTILELGNIHSHTVELDEEDHDTLNEFFRLAKSQNLIFGITLQLCDVLIWFSNYFQKNNDRQSNLLKCVKLNEETPAEKMMYYEGKEFIPEEDEEGIWHCSECKVCIQYWSFGKMRLKNVQPNTDKNSKNKYPYFAAYDRI